MATYKKLGALILPRHGQSAWNLENLFTGWHDVPLSELGAVEAKEAGRLMQAGRLAPPAGHTSLLVRAVPTADLAPPPIEGARIPLLPSSRLQDPHYGAPHSVTPHP